MQRRRGEGTEFQQLRDYHLGDSMRQVDACAITLTFAGPAQLAGRHRTLSMDAAQQRHASSDVPARHLPASMRTR